MKFMKGILSTTHVDRQNEQLTLNALESMIEQSNSYYIPVNYQHDPRIPPIGRIKSVQLIKLDDNEYGLEGEIEIFEKGDSIPIDLDESKSIRIHEYNSDTLNISYDISYLNTNMELDSNINELNSIIKSLSKPVYEAKKSIDPLSVLTIGGVYILGKIFDGFLQKIGEDSYKLLKQKLKEIFHAKDNSKENLLNFELNVKANNEIFAVNVLLTNPKEQDIDEFIEYGLKKIDEILPLYYTPNHGIKKIVYEYKDRKIYPKYGILKNGVPLYTNENESHHIDIYV